MRIKQFRRSIGYVTNMPRCCHCKFYKGGRLVLVNSLPRKVDPDCKLHDIPVRMNALCRFFEPGSKEHTPTKKILDALRES